MSRRQRTTLTLSVKLPLPPNMTQKAAVQALTDHLKCSLPGGFAPHEIYVKLEGKETTYL